ncbi:MAG: hypothetical protein WCK60_00690 [Candidatus Nomurabacteria bacterium]
MLIIVQIIFILLTAFFLGRAFAKFMNSLLRQLFGLPCEKNTGKLSMYATKSQKASFHLFRNIMASQIVLTPLFTSILLMSEIFYVQTINGVAFIDFYDALMYIAVSLLLSLLWIIIVLFSVTHSKRIFYLFTRELKHRKPSR